MIRVDGRAIAALACSAPLLACTTPAPVAQAPEAEAVCPATVEQAAGVVCTMEGLACSPQYMCGVAVATATCTCTAGAFLCTDVTGVTIGPDASPACPATAATATCPAAESIASGRACTEQGLMCFYPSACSENAADYDTCECSPVVLSDGGTTLQFQCSVGCNYDAALVEFDAGAEASDAAPADAEPLQDVTLADSPSRDGT
jgi:hypothetical protein